MPDQFRIVRYRPDDRVRVFDLIRAVHHHRLAERLIRQWDWKYDANPFNREAAEYRRAHRDEVLAFNHSLFTRERFERFCRKWGINPDEAYDDGPYILLMKTGDRPVAMQASFPQRFVVAGKEHWVCNGADLAVHPDFRNRGLALPLTNRLLTEHPMMISWFNASINRIRRGWHLAMTRRRGDTRGGELPQARLVAFAKPLNLAYAAGKITGSRILGRATAALAAAGRPIANLVSRPATTTGLCVAEIDSPGDDFDQLWNRMRDSRSVLAVRDRRALTWRFAERPDVSYRFLVAMRDSRMLGYLVFRQAEIEGATWGYLADFLVEDYSSAIFRILLRGAEDCLVREGAQVIVCDPAPAPFRTALIRCGYFPWRTREAIYLSINLNSGDRELQAFANMQQRYVTMADGDRDISF